MNATTHELCSRHADGARRARPQGRPRLIDATLTESGQ
jgi:hypothetical protein